MGAVEKWSKAALDVFPAYLAHLVLLAVALLLWGWNPGGTAGSGGVMMLELC